MQNTGNCVCNEARVGVGEGGYYGASARVLQPLQALVRAFVHLCGLLSMPVSHSMMAAGHPRLSFELDLFSTMQAHHRVDADYAARKRVVAPAQVWAIGQASAVERVLRLYSDPRLGQDGAFPQLVFFDCHSCHRRISDEPDARPQALSNPFRPTPVGTPIFNDENMIMLSVSARQASPQLADRSVHQLHRTLNVHGAAGPGSTAIGGRLIPLLRGFRAILGLHDGRRHLVDTPTGPVAVRPDGFQDGP